MCKSCLIDKYQILTDIETILQEIKKKAASNSINLLDTIDLSMSYIENGKKVENRLNIKDESSSGGNILLKVAIAMSILSRYTNPDRAIYYTFKNIQEEGENLEIRQMNII